MRRYPERKWATVVYEKMGTMGHNDMPLSSNYNDQPQNGSFMKLFRYWHEPKINFKKISSYEIPTEEVKFGIHFSIRFYFVVIIDWLPVYLVDFYGNFQFIRHPQSLVVINLKFELYVPPSLEILQTKYHSFSPIHPFVLGTFLEQMSLAQRFQWQFLWPQKWPWIPMTRVLL